MQQASKITSSCFYFLGIFYLQAKLSTSGDEAWKEREAAAFALGAIADDCSAGLLPHLPELAIYEYVCS
ncbi:hypothetical protein FEM48_Zijuj05G0099500 [Ziziphus jujuba var. spinosa]|uniref:Uncharacterized protein n=1 Tax=Ziziphus jujuba var. spinosa TaxID=714518 RepID=A0A978VEA7_ZIZJJ|nr:hypothetical protein FEM48_Zijuj05G0099500 [Ziziphus jujuba var. spinosa]